MKFRSDETNLFKVFFLLDSDRKEKLLLLLPGHQQEAARMMGLSLVAGVSCVSVLGTNLIWKAKFFNEIVKIDA